MPRELRKIYFNDVDLTHAIDDFRVEKPQFLPQGVLSRVEVQPDNLLVRLQLKYLDNTHLLDYQIEYEKILDVLIAYCLEHRIPLPAAGTKAVYADNGEVVLEIVLGAEVLTNVPSRPGDWTRLRGVG
jgi:hypothetical protein